MKILFATPECAPWVKTGGLGDVSAALPEALAALGLDVRVLVPGYPAVMAHARDAREAGRVALLASRVEARLLYALLPSGVGAYVLDCPSLFGRRGGPYGDDTGADWPDNALRFAALSQAAALLGGDGSPAGWSAEVVHCNDWPAGLAPAYLEFAPGPCAASVITVHNLAFQGNFDPALLGELELPASSFSVEGLEFHGRISFMKAGLYYADAITTVSEGYAREICTPEFGCGLHGLLQSRRGALAGITNGIDTRLWDASRDARIPSRYSARSLYRKKRDKEALQKRMKLEPDPDVPLLGVVSRLTHQKGTDLIAAAGAEIAALPAQLVVLGNGDPAHEKALRDLAGAFPDRVAVEIGFDEDLAHLIEAGADVFLMPSRFEPCGMNQMYSQRYGTPPVVHATGGLADTVVDCTAQALEDGTASGFLFSPADSGALLAALRRALGVYRDRRAWSALQKNGMGRDFSWTCAAGQYARLYRELVERRQSGDSKLADSNMAR
jgi:starch synthase